MVIDFRPLDASGKPAARQISAWPEWSQVYVQILTPGGTLRFSRTREALDTPAYAGQAQGLTIHATVVTEALSAMGAVVSVQGANPAAGAEFSVTVPVGTQWRLLSLAVRLVTGVAAANRRLILVVDDGTNALAYAPCDEVQTASLTYDYTAAALGVYTVASLGYRHLLIPPRLLLGPGYRIRSITSNIDAGDNYGAPQLLVEQWTAPLAEIHDFWWRGPLWGIADSGVVQAEIEIVEESAASHGRFDHVGGAR